MSPCEEEIFAPLESPIPSLNDWPPPPVPSSVIVADPVEVI
jgi:hypothetical protein